MPSARAIKTVMVLFWPMRWVRFRFALFRVISHCTEAPAWLGLGKTLTSIALAWILLKQYPGVDRIVVVTPVRRCYLFFEGSALSD